MKTFIAIESSSNGLIVVVAKNKEAAYHAIGKAIYNLDEPIDSGNVDVELFEIPVLKEGDARRLGSP